MKNNEERPVIILYAILFLLICVCSTFVLHDTPQPTDVFIGSCKFFSLIFSIGGLVGCCTWLILTANKNN